MNFLRTQTLTRLADSLKLRLNGELWKTQSNLNIEAGTGISFTQTEDKDLTTLLVGLSENLGYYGSFWDSTTQTVSSTTTAYLVTMNTSDGHSGVNLVGGSRLTVDNTGVYNLAFSAQLTNTDTQAHDATFWIRKNGTDVTQSASVVTVPSTHGGVAGHHIFYVNLIQSLSASDYLEIVWAADSTSLKLETIAAGVSPTHPLSPSIIVSLTQVNNSTGTAGGGGGGGSGTVTSVSATGSGGILVSGSPITSSGTLALSLGSISPTSVAASGTVTGSNLSGTNTGDQSISITGDVTASSSTGVLTALVTKINGTSLSSLGTGILKNTGGTGVPSIAVAGDFPTLNQNTTGTAANVTGTVALANGGTGATDAATARTNLGLGTAAVTNSTAYATAAQGTKADNVGAVNGLVKSNGSSTFSAAVANTDYLTPSGSGASLTGITATQVGLGSVTNDAQTKASVVPNTVPLAGQIMVGNAGGTAYAPVSSSGDVTVSSTGAFTIGAGRVTNSMLTSSSITIAGTSTSLGGSISQDTITGLSTTGIVKRTGANTLAVASAGTDYLTPTGSGASLTGITATQVGLGSVTNDAQTKASVVPNTLPSSGQILVGNAGGTAYAPVSSSGDVTVSSTGAFTIGAGKVTNAMLTSSSITIAGTSTSLGGSITQDTITGLSSTGLIKRTGANALAVATLGTDYGTVTSVSVVTANGVSGTVSTTTTSPAITLTLGAITPSSVAATGTISGSNIGTATGYRLLSRSIITNPTTSYTTPAGCTRILVQMIGAGGGGGGCTASSTTNAAAGGGGGGGAYAEKWFTVTASTAYTVAVGAGGTAGANTGATGGNGGSTTFAVGATTVTAPGGSGGTGMAFGTTVLAAAGGVGGVTSTNGDLNTDGTDGFAGWRSSGTVACSGAGACGLFGIGGAQNQFVGSAAGNNGTGYGAGGSGAIAVGSATARAGGTGSNGVIIVYEYGI